MAAVLTHQAEGECYQIQDHYGKVKICSYSVGSPPQEELPGVLPQGFLQVQSQVG